MSHKKIIRQMSLSIILIGTTSTGCSLPDYAYRDRYYHRAEKATQQIRTRLTSPNINDRQDLLNDVFNFELPPELTIGELYPRLLNDPNVRIRGNTIALIGSMSNSQGSLGVEVAPLLNYALQDPNPKIRKLAAQISLSGNFSRELVRPELIRRLADPDERVRRASIYTLVASYKLEEKPIDEQNLLQNSRLEARESLATLLGYRQQLNPSDLEKLLKLTQDTDSKVRSKAIWTLAKWIKKHSSKNPKIISELLPFLTDADPSVRMSTAYALGQSGKSAVKAIPYLLALLKDQNRLVRSYAVEALGNIASSQEITPHLNPLLNDSSLLVRELTTKALQKDKN